MNYRLSTLLAGLALMLLGCASNNSRAAKSGIVILGEDSPRHRLAAREFSDYAGRITGREFPVLKTAAGLDTVILIGRPTKNSVPGLEARLPDVPAMLPRDTGELMSPEQDSYVILSVPARNRTVLLLAGLNDVGTLYAVYDYFERFCNVGYFVDGERVEKMPELPLSGIDTKSVPRVGFREMISYVGPSCGYGFMPVRTHYWNLRQIDNFISWYAKNRLNVLLLELAPAYSGVLEKDNPSPVGAAGDFIWPFKVRWEYWHHVVSHARERGIKVMFQTEMSDSPEEWRKVIDEYGTDHIYFSSFGESKAAAAVERVKKKAAMFKTLDPRSKFYIVAYEFYYNGWTAKDFDDLCNSPDLPDNIVLVDGCGSDWYDGCIEKANGFHGRPWGTGVIHSFTGYGDLLHSRVRLYLKNFQKWEKSRWADKLSAFVAIPEANIPVVDTWFGYAFGKMAWDPRGLTVESLANDYARARFGHVGQQGMAESVLHLEKYNNEQRPAPNIGSDGRGVMPVHRTIMTWNPHPLFSTEQPAADSKLREDLAPYFESIKAAFGNWSRLKDDPLYQNTLFELARSCLAEIATRDLIALWRHYQHATGAFAAKDENTAAEQVRAFDARHRHLHEVFDRLEYLLSKDPNYSFTRFLKTALGHDGVYPGARRQLIDRGFYQLDGYERNENYEAFHYIYRRETESFPRILKLRLDARLPDMIELGKHTDMKKLDDLRIAGNMSLQGELVQNADILAVFARIKMEALNRADWTLPATPGVKREAVERACEFLLARPVELAELAKIPPIWKAAKRD